MIGIGLVAVVLLASFWFSSKGETRDPDVNRKRLAAGDPWRNSAWVGISHESASTIPAAPANSKPGRTSTPNPLTIEGGDLTFVRQTASSGGPQEADSAEPGDNALSVKWPPLAAIQSSTVPRKPRGWGLSSTAYAATHCHFSAVDTYVHTGQYSALLQYDGTDPSCDVFSARSRRPELSAESGCSSLPS